jgi:DNA-binding response OmpR family regulator
LIADENPLVRSLVRTYLCGIGFEVVEAADGVDAIAIARTQTLRVALLDLMLPIHGGIYVLHEIRARSQLPIIMMSTLNVSEVTELTNAADAYIHKPFRTSDLASRVRSIVDREAVRRGEIPVPARA